MASNITPIAAAEAAASQTSSAAATSNIANDVNKETFLKLLVAQIRHQNPLSPMDGAQFLTQLAEFTTLEKMIDIRDDLSAIRQALEAAAQTTEQQDATDSD